MSSCDTWCGAIIGEGSLELDPLANGHQHVAFSPFSSLFSFSFLSCLTLKVLLVRQGYTGRIGCSLTAPGHHRQRASIPASCKSRRIWTVIHSSSSSPHLLCTPAPINCSWHIRHCRDFYRDDRCTNRDGACAPNWAWTAGGRFWRRGAADCGYSRSDDNWTVACRIGARRIMGAWSRIKALTWACNDRNQKIC